MERHYLRLLTFVCVALAADLVYSQSVPCDSCGTRGLHRGFFGHSFGYRDQEGPTHRQRMEAHFDVIKQHADLIARRNDAWPKPFQCYDRQAYHQIWYVNSSAGWANECTLTPDHFDAKTHHLNKAGLSKVAGIMSNLPEPARQIWVYTEGDAAIANARLSSVNEVLSENYSHWNAPPVAMTRHLPHGMSGSLVEDVQTKFVQSLPAPKVPAATGTTITGQ